MVAFHINKPELCHKDYDWIREQALQRLEIVQG